MKEQIWGKLLAGSMVAGFLAVTGCDDGSSRSGQRETPTSTAPVPSENVLLEADEHRLEAGLIAPDAAGRSAALAKTLAVQPEIASRPLLPTGAILSIDRSTFKVIQKGIATVDAEVSGPETSRWLILLGYEENEWRVIGTRRL